MGTEGVTLDFTEDAVDAVADLAAEINAAVENIGARRLATVLERLLEEISFTASDRKGETVRVDGAMVQDKVARWPAARTCRASSCDACGGGHPPPRRGACNGRSSLGVSHRRVGRKGGAGRAADSR